MHAPLRNFRVVTLAANAPVPVAAARMAQLGAKVIKVEPPDGDPLGTKLCPAWYAALIKGQKVVRLDLKQPRDRARLDGYLKNSHLLLTSSRPSSLARMSLGWKQLHAKFPDLSHVALVGHPAPRQEVAGHDLTYQAQLGLLSPPNLPNTLMADMAAAERVFGAAVIALLSRQRPGKGAYTEVTLEEAAKAFVAPLQYGLTARGGALGGGLPQYNLYRAGDFHGDRWIAVAALEPGFVKRLQQDLRLTTLDHNALARVFLTRTADEWEKWALEHDLPIAAVRSVE
jgi:alpha-methylacyl-CoA racemase